MGPLVLEPRSPDHVQEYGGRPDDEQRGQSALDAVGDEVADLGQHDHGAHQAGRETQHDHCHIAALVRRVAAPVEEAQDHSQPDDDQHDELKVLHPAMIRPRCAGQPASRHGSRRAPVAP